MRFSLSNLFLAVTMIAIACAAIVYHNRGWADGIVTLTLLLFAAMLARAISTRGCDQAFAFAFVMVGGAYLFIATSESAPVLRKALPTKYALAIGWKLTADPKMVMMPDRDNLLPLPVHDIIDKTNDLSNEFEGPFFLIGHCLFSWLFGLVAGWFAGWMCAKRDRSRHL